MSMSALAAAGGKGKAKGKGKAGGRDKLDLIAIERPRVMKDAKQYLEEPPITVTASSSPRSAGGKHDYFSQADYWWPDPKNPKGPYIQRDGQSNPDNFDDHRKAMRRLSVQVPALTAAWVISKDRRYAEHAIATCAPGSSTRKRT